MTETQSPPIVTDAYLSGWRVVSELPLPELHTWCGDNRAPDIHIRLGEPPPPPPATLDVPYLHLAVSPTQCYFQAPGIGTFVMTEGREILIAPDPACEPYELRNYIYGTMMAAICHQRGAYPLHGSCLRIGDGACIFSGNSGAGKSTLAAALAAHGHTLLSDDVCVLDLSGPAPLVLPSFPRVKLWPRSMEALGFTSPKQPQDGEKHHFRFQPVESFIPTPVPLSAIYFLRPTEDPAEEGMTPLSPIEAVPQLDSQVYRSILARQMGRAPELFAATARLAGAVPVRLLTRRLDLARLNDTVHLLEELHSAVSAVS